MDDTIGTYDKIAKEWADKFFSKQVGMEPIYKKFIELMKGGGKVLDVGCGPGHDVRYFLGHGLDVVGIDLSDGMLAEARKRVPKGKFIKMDMRELNFDAASFDGVWACASLLHLKRSEVPSTLAEIRRVLKPSGKFYIAMKEGGGERVVRGRFFTYYSEDELKEVVTRSGFKVLDTIKTKVEGTVWIHMFAQKM